MGLDLGCLLVGNMWLEVGKKFLAGASAFPLRGSCYFAALLCVQPSKADNFDTFTLVSNSATITFTLPQTLNPSSVNWAGMINLPNAPATFNGGAYTVPQGNQEVDA